MGFTLGNSVNVSIIRPQIFSWLWTMSCKYELLVIRYLYVWEKGWTGINIFEIKRLLHYCWHCSTTLAMLIFLLLSNFILWEGVEDELNIEFCSWANYVRGGSLGGSFYLCKYKTPPLTGNPSVAFCCPCSFPETTSPPCCLDNRMVAIYKWLPPFSDTGLHSPKARASV